MWLIKINKNSSCHRFKNPSRPITFSLKGVNHSNREVKMIVLLFSTISLFFLSSFCEYTSLNYYQKHNNLTRTYSDTIPELYKKSKALKYLNFKSDSTLFNSFIKRIDERKTPFLIEADHYYPSVNNYDSVVFTNSNEGENLTNRVISVLPKYRNELTPLFKFFRPIISDYKALQEVPIKDENKIEYGSIYEDKEDSSVAVINQVSLSQRKDQRFYLLYIVANLSVKGFSDYLCSFSQTATFIQAIYIPPPTGYNMYSKCYFDSLDNLHIKFCDGLYKEIGFVETCRYYTYKINDKGYFELTNNKVITTNNKDD